MKECNVLCGQTSKMMVSNMGEGVSKQRQQRNPFMPQGSGAGLSCGSLFCTVPLYGRVRSQVSLIPDLRKSTTLVDLFVAPSGWHIWKISSYKWQRKWDKRPGNWQWTLYSLCKEWGKLGLLQDAQGDKQTDFSKLQKWKEKAKRAINI